MEKIVVKNYADEENCPVRNVLDRFGDKWSMLVIMLLGDMEVLRFNELHKYIDSISQKMLAVTLKKLEADNLINRTMFPEIPPRVEYSLTERGKSLLPLLLNLVQWANKNMGEITQSRLERGTK
ncbi:winged helix-turn-helix transcriptional regulator [Flagellimonas aequoris]|uniref:Transcriptional regulator n=1 Tax=Flagellimonas aequoris TaxID=2306997 RepID=A0A418N4G6_9FLAO|nr:helix-turn-helix domain-containing protein [Allomuricauda aequoris]RIV68742.1 transcriptional regulator [Allomuricauda aequoris]TXK00440.1 helix-turn-helix transcriptional regulator [Allomuricauda aequoris]